MAANGKLTSSDVALIPGTSQTIKKSLLPSVIALRAAFEKEFGKPLKITDGYRSYEIQERIFLQRYTTNYMAQRPRRYWQGKWWYQRPGTASAAVPGTSNHGWGIAIDFGSNVNGGVARDPKRWTAEHRWMRENAARFGWTHPVWAHDNTNANGTDEPWHFEGVVVPVSNYISVPGVGDINIPDVGKLPGALTPEDDVSQEDVRIALATLFDEAANRSTPTGRNFANDLVAILGGPQAATDLGPVLKQLGNVGETVVNNRQTIPLNTWAVGVRRDNKSVPALQELADAKSAALRIEATLAAQRTVLESLVTALANVSGGEKFDEERLLNTLEQKAYAGAKRAIDEGAVFNVEVSVTPRVDTE